MKGDYGSAYKQSRTRDTRNSQSKSTYDKGFDELLNDFNAKFKIEETKQNKDASFNNKYQYYKEFLENFKDRKRRSSSRQIEDKEVLNNSNYEVLFKIIF